MKLSELKEAIENRSLLYHFTGVANVYDIVKHGFKNQGSQERPGFASFTRDKLLGSKPWWSQVSARIAFDKSTINSKIIPHAGGGYQKHNHLESEELVRLPIPNMKRCIVSIDILQNWREMEIDEFGEEDAEIKTTEDLLQKLTSEGWPINYVDKW